MKKYLPFLVIFIFCLVYYLPIFSSPNILVSRGNDLTEFFSPIFYFVKQNLLITGQLPLWNNLFFSGTPLLPDPQAPLFYLPNLIFLLFNEIDTGFIISIFLHIVTSGVAFYFLAHKGFRFSKIISVFCALIYVASPKLSGFIEAGHFGLITSWAWLPLVYLSAISLSKRPTIKKSIFFAITLAAVFYTHILIFAIATISSVLLYLYISFCAKNNFTRTSKFLLLSGVFCFGLIAIAFIPQLSWQSETTRDLLLQAPDLYPKWNSKIEFIKASFSPLFFGSQFIRSLDTEKTIALGSLITFLAIFGFIKLQAKLKILITLSLFIIFLLVLNTSSPIYEFLLSQNWYILLRVSTRFWFLTVFIFIYLAGFGLEKLLRTKKRVFLIYLISFFAITELLLTSWTKILKPIVPNSNLAPKEVYEFLASDKDEFRVFCLTRCLSQHTSARYGLELAEGYGTLQQKNYYLYSQQLSQAFYRNRYTLAIPPFEIYKFEKLEPNSPNLAAFNIKYILSDHLLKDKNLKYLRQIGSYYIYENTINFPRSNYKVATYTPNYIKIDTTNFTSNELVLSEVYNKDWQAFTDTNRYLKIFETPDKTRAVNINKDIKSVTFIYNPISFKIGSFITLLTTAIIILYLIKKREKK